MKKAALALNALVVCVTVQAAKPEPFAYTESQAGVTLFYHDKCPVQSFGDWRLGLLVNASTTWKGCWIKRKEPNISGEMITFCTVEKNDKGELEMVHSCLFADPSTVLKGNPIPEKAF